MRTSDLITQLLPRAQRLGLVDPATGFLDREELRTYLGIAVQYLATRYQLRHFLHINRELLRTAAGVEQYPFSGYGLAAPMEERYSGLMVADSDGTDPTNLQYYEPQRYELIRDSTGGRPAWFTLAEGSLFLMPIPDAVYIIQAIARPVQETDEIPDPYVACVSAEALWRLASDSGRATQSLMEERTQTCMKTVNDEARQRQRFYESRERFGYGRSWRRWGR